MDISDKLDLLRNRENFKIHASYCSLFSGQVTTINDVQPSTGREGKYELRILP